MFTNLTESGIVLSQLVICTVDIHPFFQVCDETEDIPDVTLILTEWSDTGFDPEYSSLSGSTQVTFCYYISSHKLTLPR